MTVARARALSHLLARRDDDGPASVAAHLLATQAQAFGPARWALGARSGTATLAEVNELFDGGTLVRTWTMRGTLHIVSAADAMLMLNVTADKQRHLAEPVMRRDGMDADVVSRAFRALEDAIGDQGPLDRKRAMDVMDAGGVNTEGGRGYHLIREAALGGLVVWGPVSGTQQSLVLTDQWLPPTARIERDEAIVLILLRYLELRSPATVRDFAWWLGITLTEARRALAAAGDSVVPSDAGVDFLALAGAVDSADRPEPRNTAALLPAFDEYLLGYQDRSSVLGEHRKALVMGTANGVFQPIIVLDGVVAGTWRPETSAAGLRVILSPFAPLSSRAAQRLAREAARYARFLAVPLLEVFSGDGTPIA
ncbi:winged helix DNA-binding domain-containing protein [Humibacter soli]